MMKKYAFLLLLLTQLSWSDDGNKSLAGFDPKVDIIADNYEAGPFLIYNCEEKHWVCVTLPYFKECEEKRFKETVRPATHHSCAAVGEFPTKKSCFQRQLFMTTHQHGSRFCIKDEWKGKAVN